MSESEKKTELYLREQMVLTGGQCYKWEGPMGAPDRICISPSGYITFVEVKSEGVKPESYQLRFHQQMRELNCCVLVLDTKASVDNFIRRTTNAVFKCLKTIEIHEES